MKIENCVALVTGANRGLGKTFAEALLGAGAAKVYAGARDPRSVTGGDDRIVPLRLDVTDEDQVNAAAAAFQDVTLLINNAGVMKGSPMLAEGSEDAFRAEMEVNVFGALRMVRAFAPILRRNGGGAIANILSVVSLYVYPFNATYGASKHAALALTDAVRIQLKAQHTHVVGVFAGFIDTDMAATFNLPKTPPRQVAERTLAGIRESRNYVYADERARQAWDSVRADPAEVHARMQRVWDEKFGH